MNEISALKSSAITSNTKTSDAKDIKTKENSSENAAVVTKEFGEPAVVYKANDVKEILNNYDKKGHIYNKSKIDELKSQSDAKLNELRESVKSMIEAQGYKFEDIMNLLDDPDSFNDKGNLVDKNGKEIRIEIDEDTRAKAQEAISEDGFYGVKKTSARIIEFAKVISGNDPSKIETLKKAIIEGFEAAKEAFGGELPEISHKTHEAVLKGLDEWANGENSEKSEITNPED